MIQTHKVQKPNEKRLITEQARNVREMFNIKRLIKHHYTNITEIEMSLCPK